MSLYNGPPRGGSRGGADQFSWENVKADKDREYYLGHSVKALTGRWQKGKDVYWYTREKGDDADRAAAEELHAVKQREEELMAEALGIKPKLIRAPKQPQLDQKDMAQLMSRGEEEEEGADKEADRIKGLGYSVTAVRGAGDAEHEVLPGTLPAKPPQGPPGQLPPPPTLTEAEAKRMRRAQKKAAKEARRAEKKEKRKAKKALKKAKKLAKRARKGSEGEAAQPAAAAPAAKSDSSPSSSSSDGADSDSAAEPPGVAQAGGRAGRHDSPSPPRMPTRRSSLSPVERGRTETHRQGSRRNYSPDEPRHREPQRRHASPSPKQHLGRLGRDHEDDRNGRRHGRGDDRHARDSEERRRGSPERSHRYKRRRSMSIERRRRDRS